MHRFLAVLELVIVLTVSHLVHGTPSHQIHGSYVMNVGDRFEEMRRNDAYLVKFYAPWCGHCKKLEPVFEEVGAKLDGTGINVAKVDATLHTRLTELYEVRGFPTIIYIKGDKTVNYRGDRTADDLARFAVRCHSPALKTLHSVGGLKDRIRIKSDDAFFVYVGDQSHHLFNAYEETAGKLSVDVDFYTTSPKAFQQEVVDIKLPVVFVYKDDRRFQFNPITDSSLQMWVEEERFTAIQPATGSAYYDLMSLDKTLVLLAIDTKSSDRELKKLSKRIVEQALPVALDRNLRQFQFVLLTSTTTVANIILGEVNMPFAMGFNPTTHLYYLTGQKAEDMVTEDWKFFLADIITGKRQGEGGRGILRQLKRACYGIITSLVDLWLESRFLFCVVVVIPTMVISIVVYTLCCATWSDEEPEDEEEEEGEEEELDSDSPQIDKDSGHYKTE